MFKHTSKHSVIQII